MDIGLTHTQREYLDAVKDILVAPGINDYCRILEKNNDLMHAMCVENRMDDKELENCERTLELSNELRKELAGASSPEEIEAIRKKIHDREDMTHYFVELNPDYLTEFLFNENELGPMRDMVSDKIMIISNLEQELGEAVKDLSTEAHISEYERSKQKVQELESRYSNLSSEFVLLLDEESQIRMRKALRDPEVQMEIQERIRAYRA